MTLAANIILKNQESPTWVLKIDSATATYFSTGPVATLATEVPIISKVSLPGKSVSLRGGGATVSTLSVTLQDILLSDATYAASKVFHDTAIIGKACTLFLGYAADAWDGDSTQANYSPRFYGYVKDATYDNGLWTIKCESVLSKAKGVRAPIGEGWLKVKSQYFSKDDYMAIRCRVGFPAIAAPANLLTDSSWETGTAAWTAGAHTTAYTRGTATPAPEAGTYRAEFASDTNGVMASIYQDVTLPAGHKPGHVYAFTAWLRRLSTAGFVHGRVVLYGMDAGGNQYEIAYGGARKLKNDGWGRHSTSIAIWHPSTTKIRVVVTGVPVDKADLIYVDNAYLGQTPYIAAIKRELYPIISIDETTTPTQMVVAHSLAGTRENNQAKGQKGSLCKVLTGFAADVALRLLTTTAAGGNGAWDHADGFGAGIPVATIDTTAFAATRTVTNLGPAFKLCLTVTKDQTGLLDLIEKEILIPCGMWLYEAANGLLTLSFIPEVGTLAPVAGKALDNTKQAGRIKVERRVKDLITQVNYLADYDGQEATSTPETPEFTNKKKRKQIPERTLKDAGESSCIGRWLLDERDYLATGALGDSAKTLQTRFGTEEVTIKSQGLRSHVSYAAGIPCPLEYDTAGETGMKVFKGERAGRLTAQRLLGWCASPPCVAKFPGFAALLDYSIGDQLELTSDDIPDLTDAGGGMGVTSVECVVIGVTPSADTMLATVDLFVAGWAKALAATAWSPGAVAPSAGTVFIEAISLDSVEAGNYPWMLDGNYHALRVVQTYDGNPGSVPTAANYLYTEVRINWTPSDSAGPGFVTVARFNMGRYLIALDGVYGKETPALEAVSAEVYYRWNDGTYSSAYTLTGISCDPVASTIASPTLTLDEVKRLRNIYTAEWAENTNLVQLKVAKRVYDATPGNPDTNPADWKVTKTISLAGTLTDGSTNVNICFDIDAKFGVNHADGERVCVAVQLVDQYGNKSNWVVNSATTPADSDDTAPAVPTLTLASAVNDKTSTAKKECDLTVTATWVGCHVVDVEVLEYNPTAGAVVNRFVDHIPVKGGTSPTERKYKRIGEKGNTFYSRDRGKVGTAYSSWSCADGVGAWDNLPPIGAYSIAAGGASPLITAPTATPQQGSGTSLSVDFDAHASGGTPAYAYDWDWGDGSSHGNTATPTHVFAAVGTYLVTLLVTDTSGQMVGASPLTIQLVDVAPGAGSLLVAITATPTAGTPPLTVAFTATGSGGSGTGFSYLWDMGGAAGSYTVGSAASQNPSYQFTAAGVYAVTCTITDSAGNKSSSNLTVFTDGSALVVSAGASVTVGLAPLTVAFTGGVTGGVGAMTYLWDMGGAAGSYTVGSAASQNPSFQFTAAGVYTCKLKVTDSSTPAKVGTAYVTIQILTAALTVVVTKLGGGQPFWEGDFVPGVGYTMDPVPIATPSGGSGTGWVYDWDWGDGTTHYTTNGTPPAHTYADVGGYTGSVTVSDSLGNVGVGFFHVKQLAPPILIVYNGTAPTTEVLGVEFSWDILCSGGIPTYQWSVDWGDGTTPATGSGWNGATLGGSAPKHTYTFSQSAGKYIITVFISDSVGGVASTKWIVTVTEPSSGWCRPTTGSQAGSSTNNWMLSDQATNDATVSKMWDTTGTFPDVTSYNTCHVGGNSAKKARLTYSTSICASGKTPTGVEVQIHGSTNSDSMFEVSLLVNGSPAGMSKTITKSSLGTVTLGGPLDQWGVTLVSSDIVGVQIKGITGGTSEWLTVYDVQIKEWYQ